MKKIMKEFELRGVQQGTAICLARTHDGVHWIIVEKWDAQHHPSPKPFAEAVWDDDFGFQNILTAEGTNFHWGNRAFDEVERRLGEVNQNPGRLRPMIVQLRDEIREKLKFVSKTSADMLDEFNAGSRLNNAIEVVTSTCLEIERLRSRLAGIETSIAIKRQAQPAKAG